MDPDKYQQAWQAHAAQTRVTVDADLLLKVVQLDQRSFRSGIIWIEIVGGAMVLLLLLPFWIYLGVSTSSPWTWYLTVPVLVWNVVFTLMYRIRRKQKPRQSGGPLLQCVKESLTQLEDEIWLQRNVPWWNFLPLSVSVLAFAAHSAWLRSENWSDAVENGGAVVFLLAFFCLLFFLHRYIARCARRTKFDPRRQELLTLLTSLEDETTGEESRDVVTASVSRLAEKRLMCMPSPARIAISLFGLAVAVLLTLAFVFYVAGEHRKTDHRQTEHRQAGYPMKSPFAAVRWQESQPEVRLGEEWFQLVSLDEIPTAEIVAFSRRTYGNKWRKRFEEDLVELLTRMGHPPRDSVTLVVQSRTSSETSVRKDVPMTEANRQAIKAAAEKLSESGQPVEE